jgi:uncharacterized UPF0160 family protein
MTTITTHNGVFHSDEVFATLILRGVFENIVLKRTRDQKMIEASDIVYDVGGIYDDGKNRFDHHQKGAPMRSDGSDYSSAGMIWKKFGRQYLRNHRLFCDFSETDLQSVWDQVDKEVCTPIDLVDCGKGPDIHGILTLQGLISSMNPSWNEDAAFEEAAFEDAVEIMSKFFARKLVGISGRQEAEKIVYSSLKGNWFLVLDRFVPWQRPVFENPDKFNELLFVIFPDKSGSWRVQCVPPDETQLFNKRLALQDAWAGLKGEELQKVTGIKSALFCHPGCFIAGTGTREDAIKMAELCILNWDHVDDDVCSNCGLQDSYGGQFTPDGLKYVCSNCQSWIGQHLL